MIKTRQLTYQYPGGQPIVFPDIECRSGELLLVLGQSGVGKTTLLHLLSGIIRHSEGKIVIKGQDLSSLNGRELDHFRGKNIGVIFQKLHFIRSLSVVDNLAIAQKLAGHTIDKERCSQLLEELNISDKADQAINELSQGESQRVAIARAVINQPVVILADEPTSALDDRNCESVIELLRTQAVKTGAALIIVTHDSRLKELVKNSIEIS